MSVDYEVAKDNEPKYVTIPRTQHEALVMAAKAMKGFYDSTQGGGAKSYSEAFGLALEALAALRAAGIETEG